MASLFRTWRSALRGAPSAKRTLSSISVVKVLPETPIEEETLPHYEPEQYYPVRIGDVLKAQYEVVGKLGYGAYSTSWLCQDILWVNAAVQESRH